MPHKRAKASVRKGRKAEVDLPVTNNDMNSEDTPKGFSRLMRYKEFALQKRKDKMNAKETNTGNSSKPSLQMQPGERLKDFVGRVENQYQSDLLAAQKKTKTVSARKKRNQELRKQKKTAKQQKELEYYGGRDFDDLKDNVKFGEVADAPPILTKLPKARGRGKETLEAKTKQAIGSVSSATTTATKPDTGYESEEDENMKALKASHKRKLQNMSAAARKQLDYEREMVIEAYRAKKAKRMAEKGLL